ncbi:unnamed protein product, partial [Mesorhabditis spiculigera]
MARKRHPTNEGATDPAVEKPRNRGKEEPQKGAPTGIRENGPRRRDGVNRREARQTLLHQLIWTDPDTVKKMGDGKWAVLVASTETYGATPRQIWGRTFENGQVVEQVVIVVQRGDADTPIPTREQLNDGELPTQVIYWEPTAINDINTTCATIAKFSASCWKEMLLVPACQLQLFTDFFHWMKETRDNLYRRDTQSIRLDRLMCIEDVVQVIGDSANGRRIQSPFGNPFMQMPMADGGEYHGNDDAAAIEEHGTSAEVLRAVSAWLDANDTIGAETRSRTCRACDLGPPPWLNCSIPTPWPRPLTSLLITCLPLPREAPNKPIVQ